MDLHAGAEPAKSGFKYAKMPTEKPELELKIYGTGINKARPALKKSLLGSKSAFSFA